MVKLRPGSIYEWAPVSGESRGVQKRPSFKCEMTKQEEVRSPCVSFIFDSTPYGENCLSVSCPAICLKFPIVCAV